jgi:hypothetical protein
VIGLDFPVKPQWIHDVHQLWQPAQPIGALIEAALARMMGEVEGSKSRRNSLTIILRYFVATVGRGQSRRTAARDVWVAYSRAYPVSTLAPAYLTHLIAQNAVAAEASRFIAGRYSLEDKLRSGVLRRHVAARFGERKVVTNAASAFLRTLQYFDVLAPGGKAGRYVFARRLPVPREAFPLVVWSWWQAHRAPHVDFERFGQDPVAAFLAPATLSAHWTAFQSNLWSLEERPGVRRVTLKHVEAQEFEDALVRLVPGRTAD